MKFIKKNAVYLMSLIVIIWLGYFWLCEWQGYRVSELETDMPYIPSQSPLPECDSTNIWDCVSIKEKKDTIIVRLLNVFWLDDDTERDHKFIDYARAIINMALWLVAFIALLMSIYTFYMMFFTENEAGIKKAKGNLVGIFIALGILWLAWIIVSFIFWWYQSNWKENEDDIQSNKISATIDSTLKNNIYLNV